MKATHISQFILPLLLIGAVPFRQGDEPRVVTPGIGTAPPSDAIVLFSGKNLEKFTKRDGTPAAWPVKDGVIHVQKGGGIFSKDKLGNAQIHVEFATPSEAVGEGQGRGNSGVYVQGRYEVQVLDSYENKTYPDGQCGAIYGQHPPLVNVSCKPGEWQSYDIVFRAATYDEAGENKTKDATMTVFHNGVLIQDHATVTARTAASPFAEGAGKGPLYLQDHGNPVRYRNIWYRPL